MQKLKDLVHRFRSIGIVWTQVLLFLFLLFPFHSFSGDLQKKTDSLKQIVNSKVNDTIKILALKSWDDLIYVSDPELDFELNRRMDSICARNLKKVKHKKLIYFFTYHRAAALNVMGLVYKDKGEYAKAVEAQTQSLKLKEKIGDKKGIGISLNNIGNIYKDQKDFKRAIDFLNRSLKIRTEINDVSGIAGSLNNIGAVYFMMQDYENSVLHYEKAMKILLELGDKGSVAVIMNNIGNIYKALGEIDKNGNSYNNFQKALDYFNRCLKVHEEVGNRQGISATLNNMGDIYAFQKKYDKAIEYSDRSLKIALELGLAIEARNTSQSLWNMYKAVRKFDKALEMHELYISIRDTLTSIENERAIIQMEYKYNYDKKALADSLKNAELKKVTDAQIARKEAEIRARKNEQIILYGGLGLVLLFSIFMVNRFRVTQKQKRIIEKQKLLVEQQRNEMEKQKLIVEEKNKEIIDSIIYAKRIQQALLPSERTIERLMNATKSTKDS